MRNRIVPALLKLTLLLAIIYTQGSAHAQGSVSATYTAGDIPTSYNAFDPSCNGNDILLQVTLPSGGDTYPVTSIRIMYTMTASGIGQMGQQRSQVKCVNTNTTELAVYSGLDVQAGTFSYDRIGVTIANGTYPGGAKLSFEMHAWRTVEVTPGCNTSVNKVDNGSWTITVFYGAPSNVPKMGINTLTPASTLDINGKIRVGDDVTNPVAGMIRWNNTTSDFEGYNGSKWLSLTNRQGHNGNWGNNSSIENSSYLASDGAANDYFGCSISISGNYAIIGAYGNDIGANVNQGSAYIFVKNVNYWTQAAVLTASDGAANDNFGWSVSVSGDYAIVGAPFKTVGGNTEAGKAYVFFKNASNVWNQQAILTASDGTAGDRFGYSVSNSGDYAVVGAYNKKIGANTNQGRAYTFARSGTAWSQQAILNAADGAAFDNFGWSVGLSGDYALVGAPQKSVPGNAFQGALYVFKRSGTSWAQQAKLTASDGASSDQFGYSVSISGDYIISGAFNKAVGPSFSQGQAYIFSRNGSTWTEQAILTSSDGMITDQFGYTVSISGDYAIVSAYNKNIGGNDFVGSAYVYARNGNTWSQQAVLRPSDGVASDHFGKGVGISGSDICVGAIFKTNAANNSQGRIYFFRN